MNTDIVGHYRLISVVIVYHRW